MQIQIRQENRRLLGNPYSSCEDPGKTLLNHYGIYERQNCISGQKNLFSKLGPDVGGQHCPDSVQINCAVSVSRNLKFSVGTESRGLPDRGGFSSVRISNLNLILTDRQRTVNPDIIRRVLSVDVWLGLSVSRTVDGTWILLSKLNLVQSNNTWLG